MGRCRAGCRVLSGLRKFRGKTPKLQTVNTLRTRRSLCDEATMATGTGDVVVGAVVKKKFGTTFFSGSVTEVWKERGKDVAHIVYEDGGAKRVKGHSTSSRRLTGDRAFALPVAQTERDFTD